MKFVLFANTGWYLYNFRLPLALALRQLGHEVVLVSPPDLYGPRLGGLGFRWIPAPMQRRSLNPLRELVLLHWLRGILRSEKVDVIHAFTIKCAVYGSLAAIRGHAAWPAPARVNSVAGMGYVFSSHDLRARLLRPVVSALMRIALNAPNARVILQNEDDVAFFEGTGLVDAEHIRLIHGSGVNCTRFAPLINLKTSGAEPIRVLLAARLLWDKGVREFVQAARSLRSLGRSTQFLLAGDPDMGNPASVPESFLSEAEAAGLIVRLGHVEDMASLYRSVDVVALPSYREGLPKCLIEAAACGLPLVTTDVPGCRRVVTHDVDGLLIPARDAQALAQAIITLEDSPQLRMRLGLAAREKALREFDERLVVARTLEVYSELLRSPLQSSSPVRTNLPTRL